MARVEACLLPRIEVLELTLADGSVIVGQQLYVYCITLGEQRCRYTKSNFFFAISYIYKYKICFILKKIKKISLVLKFFIVVLQRQVESET